MQQFVVTAYDGSDSDAAARRQKARTAHLAGAEALKAEGKLIAGGAILDSAGNMIGSTLYMEFANRAALDEWLQQDPYVTGDVWREISVQPIRLAVIR